MSTIRLADSQAHGAGTLLAPPAAARIGALIAEPDESPDAARPTRALGILAILLIAGLHAAGGSGFLGASAGVAQALSGSAREESPMGQSRKFGAMAGAIALSLASAAAAQEAVQWRVEDGGNGHWYARVNLALTWSQARIAAEERGGHLVTVTTNLEWQHLKSLLSVAECWAGLSQSPSAPNYAEPSGGWSWVTGEPFQPGDWMSFDDCPAGPPAGCACGGGAQDAAFFTGCCSNILDDIQDGSAQDCTYYPGDEPDAFIIEWSADCNNDGIVDFGQIRDGSLDDANGNNIPDCCDQDQSCQYQPVQWTTANGGNGHWYQLRLVKPEMGWSVAQSAAAATGGHLATLTSAEENNFVFAMANVTPAYGGSPVVGPWVGGLRIDDQWSWVTGESWNFANWLPPNPDGPGTWGENRVCLTASGGRWNDFNESGSQPGLAMRSYVTEWSADCNNDGIVDFGQIRDGSLPDFDCDNIPDCCEAGTTCIVGSYPVQWPASEGGNGHWYRLVAETVTWTTAHAESGALGGHLVTLQSVSEAQFVRKLGLDLCWIGLKQDTAGAAYSEPAGGWSWVTSEPLIYAEWRINTNGQPNEPNDGIGKGGENWALLDFGAVTWNDTQDNPIANYCIEWSADCNNDGIVDFGQIRDGSLDDANGNNIPDCCESGTPCNCPGDIIRDGLVNGIDLAAVLNNWGAAGGGPIDADVNDDGIVDGADLSIVLGTWGPCE
jgi:hypothetical protein